MSVIPIPAPAPVLAQPVADELALSLAPVPAGRLGLSPAAVVADGGAAPAADAEDLSPFDDLDPLDLLEEPWMVDALADETGASTAEHAITVLAAIDDLGRTCSEDLSGHRPAPTAGCRT